MIQRIQTIYLFLAAAAMSVVFFFPLAELLINSKASFIFLYRGLYELKDGKEILSITSFPLAILFLISMLISFITIFLYKKRHLQMRLCVINIMLLFGAVGMIYYYIAIAFSSFKAIVDYSPAAIMPIISAILTYLAYRGVRKDELLVISMDRIR